MSNRPRLEATLELLEALKEVVCDFTAREARLEQDSRVKLASVRRRRDEGTEALNARLADDLAQTEASMAEAKAAIESRYERRRSRIASAHKTSKKRALQGVEDKEGCRKHKLQTETLQTKRNRETGLANAEIALAEFKAALATEQEALA